MAGDYNDNIGFCEVIMRYVSRMAVLGFCSVVPSVLFAQQFTITNYQFVSSQQVTTTLANVTYRADIVNTGNPEATVTATGTSLNPASFTMATGLDTLNFAPVPANSQVTSSNTFTMRVNRTVPFDFASVQWTFKTTPLPPVANAGPQPDRKGGRHSYPGRHRLDQSERRRHFDLQLGLHLPAGRSARI